MFLTTDHFSIINNLLPVYCVCFKKQHFPMVKKCQFSKLSLAVDENCLCCPFFRKTSLHLIGHNFFWDNRVKKVDPCTNCCICCILYAGDGIACALPYVLATLFISISVKGTSALR